MGWWVQRRRCSLVASWHHLAVLSRLASSFPWSSASRPALRTAPRSTPTSTVRSPTAARSRSMSPVPRDTPSARRLWSCVDRSIRRRRGSREGACTAVRTVARAAQLGVRLTVPTAPVVARCEPLLCSTPRSERSRNPLSDAVYEFVKPSRPGNHRCARPGGVCTGSQGMRPTARDLA